MRLCYLAALCLPLALYGCLTYHDPRPVGERKSDLHTATVNLAGTYDIVDSRRNHRHFTGAVIRKAYGSDGLDITLTSPTSGSALLSGKKCRGWASRSYSAMTCDSPAYGVNFYSLSTPTDLDRTVKDRGIITTFEPMTVPDGDYLLEYSDQGGRSYYYVLARKTSP